MAQMRLAREIDEARARDTNEFMEQIYLEIDNLKNENKLAKEENDSLKAELKKYRILFFIFSLIICVAVAKYLGIASRLESVETRLQDTQNWGEFVWPIEGWAAKSQSARDGTLREIFSGEFYSHKNGYKMCLSVWPDGNGAGNGTHLSVFFNLMSGPFDNILSWPFKRYVTLSLIDQRTGTDYVSYTMTMTDLSNHVNWNRPATERNAGFGIPKMIELSAISSNTGLCLDDRVFIRCIVK